MANIASGYIAIKFQEPDDRAAAEITEKLNDSGAFSYGGDPDIGHDPAGLKGGFSGRWRADDAWDWIDEQLHPEATSLSDQARTALVQSTIYGYSYEWSQAHRDEVKKEPGQTNLARYLSSYGTLGFPEAFKVIGAFDLSAGSTLQEGNGIAVTLLSRTEEDEAGWAEFEFEFSWEERCVLRLSFNLKTKHVVGVQNFSCGDPGQERDEDLQNFPDKNEFLDDLLSKRSELFQLQRSASRGKFVAGVWQPRADSRHQIFIYRSYEGLMEDMAEDTYEEALRIDDAFPRGVEHRAQLVEVYRKDPLVRDQAAFLQRAAEAAGLTDTRTLNIPYIISGEASFGSISERYLDWTQVVYGLSDRGLGDLDDLFRSYSGERPDHHDTFLVVDFESKLYQSYENGDYDTGSFFLGPGSTNKDYADTASNIAQGFLEMFEGEEGASEIPSNKNT